MPPNQNEAQEVIEAESSDSSVLNSVLDRNRMNQTRREIGMIADRSYRENLISDEAYQGYKELAEGREEHEIGAEMLDNTRRFAKEHEQKAIRIHNKIQTAIRQKVASEKDEEFLMEKMIIGNIRFTEQANEIEGLIDQKLMRMKADKDRYDKLADHKLIREGGTLNIDGNNKIDFPDEKEFLEMTVPERRELLKKLEEALPKAEKYAEGSESIEAEKRVAAYTKKLDKAVTAGIIGEHTYNKFLEEFIALEDPKEQDRWNKEFDEQMKRYRTLWVQIRSTLKDEALEAMEGMLDEHGYSDLFKKFGQLKTSESQRLCASYAGALEPYRKEGLIGRHTENEFIKWMNERDLADQYELEEKLPGQMKRYEALWQNIAELPKKQQIFLRSKIDDWGYTELNNHYKAFKSGKLETLETPKPDPLSRIQSVEVREAIVETDEMLTEEGPSKKKNFMRIVDKMFRRANLDSFDASSFEGDIRQKARKIDPTIEQDTSGRDADTQVDYEQIEDDTEILEQAGSAEVKEELGFVEVQSNSGNEKSRHTQVTINEGRGMDRLLSEESKHAYKAEELGGSDDMSLAIENSGRTVELELKEIRALNEYMRLKEQERELDEAA